MYQYAYEFEWNKTCVYYYGWFAYDDLYSCTLKSAYMLVLSEVMECFHVSITKL
jgi:hypothetical protein